MFGKSKKVKKKDKDLANPNESPDCASDGSVPDETAPEQNPNAPVNGPETNPTAMKNEVDEEGRPAGGFYSGVGIEINWQDGPLGRDKDRKAPNGAFVEEVLVAVQQRIAFYQASEFKCDANERALAGIKEALVWLNRRTKDREARQVEGTHTE